MTTTKGERVVFRAYCGNGWMIDKATREDAESITRACDPKRRVREVTIRHKAAVAKDSIGRCITCGLFRCQCKSQMPPQSPSAAAEAGTPESAGAAPHAGGGPVASATNSDQDAKALTKASGAVDGAHGDSRSIRDTATETTPGGTGGAISDPDPKELNDGSRREVEHGSSARKVAYENDLHDSGGMHHNADSWRHGQLRGIGSSGGREQTAGSPEDSRGIDEGHVGTPAPTQVDPDPKEIEALAKALEKIETAQGLLVFEQKLEIDAVVGFILRQREEREAKLREEHASELLDRDVERDAQVGEMETSIARLEKELAEAKQMIGSLGEGLAEEVTTRKEGASASAITAAELDEWEEIASRPRTTVEAGRIVQAVPRLIAEVRRLGAEVAKKDYGWNRSERCIEIQDDKLQAAYSELAALKSANESVRNAALEEAACRADRAAKDLTYKPDYEKRWACCVDMAGWIRQLKSTQPEPTKGADR